MPQRQRRGAGLRLGLTCGVPLSSPGLGLTPGLAGAVLGALPVVAPTFGEGFTLLPPTAPLGLRSSPWLLSIVCCDGGCDGLGACAFAMAMPLTSAAVASTVVIVFMGSPCCSLRDLRCLEQSRGSQRLTHAARPGSVRMAGKRDRGLNAGFAVATALKRHKRDDGT